MFPVLEGKILRMEAKPRGILRSSGSSMEESMSLISPMAA